MAPNAPTGATRTMMRITPKNTRAAVSIARETFSPASPIIEMAKPVRIDTNRTCSRSPRAIDIEARARLYDLADQESERQREGRDHLEVEQRLDADAADLLQVAHRGD